jgi:uncharacterized delta-60 repeat protein
VAGSDEADGVLIRHTRCGRLDPSGGTLIGTRVSLGTGTVGIATAGALLILAAPAASSRDPASARLGMSAERNPSKDWAYALAIQRDGKIVAAGRSARGAWRFALARYTSSGELDRGFGRGGKVLTDFGSSGSFATSIALQRDGKLVAAGHAGIASTHVFAIIRYTTRGRLDPSFGHGGEVLTRFSLLKRMKEWANALVIQRDGRVLAAGAMSDFDAFGRFAIARYDPRGQLDRSYGTGGKVVARVGSDGTASAMAIQRDSKIVTAGTSIVGDDIDIVLARFTARGKLDPTFGRGGRVVTDFGSSSQAGGVAVQADGRIVAAGRSASSDFALARYTAYGKLDPSFGSGGKVVTNFGQVQCPDDCSESEEAAHALAIQADGKIVAAGSSQARGAYGEKTCCIDDFALARYKPDGSLDPSFGNGGLVLTAFRGISIIQAIGIQSDGKIVVAGGGAGSFALARYTTEGRLDPTFGRGGKVTTRFA